MQFAAESCSLLVQKVGGTYVAVVLPAMAVVIRTKRFLHWSRLYQTVQDVANWTSLPQDVVWS